MEKINYKGYHATWFPLEQAYIVFKDGEVTALSDFLTKDEVKPEIDKIIREGK